MSNLSSGNVKVNQVLIVNLSNYRFFKTYKSGDDGRVKGKHHLKSKKDSEKGNMKVIYGAKFKFIKRKNIGCWIPFHFGKIVVKGHSHLQLFQNIF